ncbi:MAG TPA: rod shape-determining protein [Acidimicrobiales bacterium]|nr:rod shape-determining protein [Acidimicrobiales bacterium]
MTGLAVDLGTGRTRAADSSGRLVLDEPSAAAVDLRDGSLVAFGASALDLPGRSAGQVRLVRPVVHGQLQDLGLTDQVVAHVMTRARRAVGRHPEVLCTVPGLASGVQRRALQRAFTRAGAARVEFIQHAVAAGIGLRLEIGEPVASMVVDVGAGTLDASVIALGGVVTEASLPLGGNDLDLAVREACLRTHDLVVSLATAEELKVAIGAASPGPESKMEVTGRDASNGAVRTVVVSTSDVAAAISDGVSAMIAAAVRCIVEAPPDLANDLLSEGLHLAGEGSLLAGFSRRLASATGVPVHLPESPGRAAVLGAARCLRDLSAVSGARGLAGGGRARS